MFYDARSVFHSVAWSLIAFIKAWSLVDLIWTQLWSKNVCLHCTARHWYHVCWPWYDMVSSWWNFVGQRSNMVIELVGQWAGTPNVRPKFMPTFIVRPRSSARYCYSSDVRPSGVCHALIHHTGQAWCSTDSSFWTQKKTSQWIPNAIPQDGVDKYTWWGQENERLSRWSEYDRAYKKRTYLLDKDTYQNCQRLFLLLESDVFSVYHVVQEFQV